MRALYSLRPSAIWKSLKRQPASFWFVLIYLFFEYVRPQQIYEAMLGPPYALIAIILALISFLFERRKLRFQNPELLLTIFTLVVLASSVTAFEPSISFSYDNLSLYFGWVLIYLMIANSADTEERFFLFLLCFLLYSFKMAQFGTRSWAGYGFGFNAYGAAGAPGFFKNSGEFGIQMCVFFPLVVAFILALKEYWPRWLRWASWVVPGTAITGIVASSSRGALVGLAAVSLWMLLQTRHKFRGLVATVALAGIVYTITPSESKARFETIGEDNSSISRTTNWKNGLEIMSQYPLLGIGYANWRKYHAINYGTELLPHNVFIEAGAELGYIGLAAFLALIWCTFAVNARTRRLARQFPQDSGFINRMAYGLDGALVGFVASGFFVTVLYYPYFWINLAMTVALNNAAVQRFADSNRFPAQPGSVRRRGGSRPPAPEIS
ncbi:MAG: O-antigen ligase family protein [Gemmatimonadota bacterium]|nr:O-antigen ligase family protein [Gemmatimonadota bacterium]